MKDEFWGCLEWSEAPQEHKEKLEDLPAQAGTLAMEKLRLTGQNPTKLPQNTLKTSLM